MISEKQNSDISLILVTKYSSDALTLCLDSYFRNSELNHELIVIADNPSWQVLRALQERKLDYQLVDTGHFFRNCNIGAEKATRKYVGFANDDIVFGPSWDVPIQQFIETHQNALISSNLLDPNKNYFFGYKCDKNFSAFNISEFEEFARNASNRKDFNWFFWMPLLIPTTIFRKYKGFTTYSSHGHGHEINLENIIKNKEGLFVATVMSSTLFHFGATCNTDNLDSKYCRSIAGFFKCSVCGKEEEGIFKNIDSGSAEIEKLRNGEPWVCFNCRK